MDPQDHENVTQQDAGIRAEHIAQLGFRRDDHAIRVSGPRTDHQAGRERLPHLVTDDPAHLFGHAPGSIKTTLGMRAGRLLFAHQSSLRSLA